MSFHAARCPNFSGELSIDPLIKFLDSIINTIVFDIDSLEVN